MRQAWEVSWRNEVDGQLFPMCVAADEVSVWRMMYPQYAPKEDDVLAEFRRIGAEDGLTATPIRILSEDEWEDDQNAIRKATDELIGEKRAAGMIEELGAVIAKQDKELAVIGHVVEQLESESRGWQDKLRKAQAKTNEVPRDDELLRWAKRRIPELEDQLLQADRAIASEKETLSKFEALIEKGSLIYITQGTDGTYIEVCPMEEGPNAYYSGATLRDAVNAEPELIGPETE